MGEGWLQVGRFAAIAVGFPLVCFAFGWSILGFFPRLGRSERFAASWGLGAAFTAGSEFLAFVAGLDQAAFNLGAVGLVCVLAVLALLRGRHRKSAESDADFPTVVGLWALGYAELVCTQCLLPEYVGSYWYWDWVGHYQTALVFRGDLPVSWDYVAGYTLASRAPLFNLSGAFALSLTGDDFGVFQLTSALLGTCFLPALFLVLRDLCGPRAARLGLALAPLNLWMLHNAWFTWPKMLTAYYLLMGLHFYLKSFRARLVDPRQAGYWFLAFWACGFLAFMTHQGASVYVAALVLHAAWWGLRRRQYRPSLWELAALPVVAAAIAGPWYGWLLRTLGPAKVFGTTPVTLGDPNATFTPLNILDWAAYNTKSSVVPIYLIDTLSDGPRTPEAVYSDLTSIYFSQFPGALTLSLTAFLLTRPFAALWRWLRRRKGAVEESLCRTDLQSVREEDRSQSRSTDLFRKEDGLQIRPTDFFRKGAGRDDTAARQPPSPARHAAWCFALLGYLGAAVLHPGKINHGIAHSAAYPTAIVLVALAWGVLSRASRRLAALVCAGIVAEFLLMYWSHCWVAVHCPEVLDSEMANRSYKTSMGKYVAIFLRERLDGGAWMFVAAAAAVQLLLCVYLLRWVRGQDGVTPSPDRPHSP
jgi:hypothetical protein